MSSKRTKNKEVAKTTNKQVEYIILGRHCRGAAPGAEAPAAGRPGPRTIMIMIIMVIIIIMIMIMIMIMMIMILIVIMLIQ